MKIGWRTAASVTVTLLLGGCGQDFDTANHHNAHNGEDLSAGYLTGGSGGLSLFTSPNRNAEGNGAAGLGVNAYLWRGALETLKFMPLASADPFGGVIITDWWTPPASGGERFKATAYVLGRQLRADGVRVSLFRQVQQNGQWVDAPVDPGKPNELENMILAKARDLRAQNAANE